MPKIGFLGAGKMASALLSAMIRHAGVTPENCIAYDVNPQALDSLRAIAPVQIAKNPADVLTHAKFIFLAFKPQNFPAALDGLQSLVTPDHVIISILAGIRIAKIQRVLPAAQIIRVMPNTACLVGQMAAGFTPAENVTPENLRTVQQLLSASGTAIQLPENLLDAVTGLSGSGPAFVAYLIDAFTASGIKAGLSASASRELALQTFLGTAALLNEKNLQPADLINMVTSPNGTTAAGRAILEASDVKQVIEDTILRAAARSKELGA